MKERITEYIHTHRTEILEHLKTLVRIPSVRGKAEPHAPFGTECAKVLDAVAAMYEQYGFASKVCTDSGYGLSYMQGAGKTIGIFSHADVVPVGDDWIVTEPFDPIEKDGFLFGRGVLDNKQAIVASLYAMRCIKELGIPFSSTIMAFAGSNEESGMADIEAFVKEQPMPDLSIVPDMRFPYCAGEKGIMRFFATCNAPFEQNISVKGGDAFNVVLDHVEVTLSYQEDLKEELENLISGNPRFCLIAEGDTLTLTAEGVASHASKPENSENAAYYAFLLLANCAQLTEHDRNIFAFASMMLSSCYGTPFDIAFTDTVFGKTTCANGIVQTKDGCLRLSFDIRYGTEQKGSEIQEKIGRVLRMHNWCIEEMVDHAGYNRQKETPISRAIHTAQEKFCGEKGESYTAGGGTYARYIPNSLATGTFFGETKKPSYVPEGHGAVHQSDEMLDIESYLDGIVLLIMMLLEMDNID